MTNDLAETDWSPILTLQRATHATLLALGSELADLELSASEINTLANLADGRVRTVSELRACVGSRPSTVTSILDRLERRDLVTRGPVHGDRRSVVVALTASGREVAGRIRRAVGELERRALGGLSSEAVVSLRGALLALTEVSR